MAAARTLSTETQILSNEAVRRLVRDQYRLMNIPEGTVVSPGEVQDRMRALGIRAEENEFSRGILRARDGSEE